MTRLISLMGLALAPVATQSTGLLTLFLPDSEPLSLEASAVAVNTVGRDPVTTLEVACPTAASPENDACRSAGIYPAQIYHTQGSVWGGTTTYAADDSTTTWVCSLGGSDPTLVGECTKTIVGGGSTRTETAEYGNCYVAAHQRPIVVTAGLEKITPAHFMTIDASKLVSLRSSQLAAAGCPASQTTIWAGAAASTTGGASSADATTSPLAGSSGVTTTAPTQTPADSASAATTSPSGAGKGGKDPMAALLLGLGLTMMLRMVL
ncbi:hypothetical protein C8A01DRAFT_49901 [Parachaetomium inaequale]|uniref:Uncharacterized protein n=1 Tax=Parachaetomium inaequale TaxID=2588326 RepID=A0AAN6P881_9PEZI|nr:hypothetical protein C8A01DRAFT_49901 [Parachaetomium inaequale]